MTLAAPAAGLEATWEIVAGLIGRPLRRAEQAVDVLRLDQALEAAKDELELEIRHEALAATLAWVNGAAIAPALRVTAAMLEILAGLTALGREEGLLELERLGYDRIRRRSMIDAAPDGRDVETFLRRNLPAIQHRIENELVTVDLGGASQAAVARALLRVPGARDIASRVISTALIDGLAQTFDENADLVRCWEYTAILDAATCSACAPLDGSRYDTLEALYVVLPNFGPNPRCKGGGRCRCRALPCPVDEVGQNPPAPEPDAPAWRQELEAIRQRAAAGLDVGDGSQRAIADRFMREPPSITGFGGDNVPSELLQGIESDVLRAGELIDAELDAGLGRELGTLDVTIRRAQEELAGSRDAHSAAQRAVREATLAADAAEQALRRRLQERFLAQGMDPVDAYRAVRASPELLELEAANAQALEALRRALAEAQEPFRRLHATIDEAKDEIGVLQRQALRELLDEIRGMGPASSSGSWTFTTGGRGGKAKKLLDEAAELFPREWIERGQHPLKPSMVQRGKYVPGRNFSEIKLSGGDRSKVSTDPDGFATAIHELGHHMEWVDRRFSLLEWAFFQRRTRAPGYGEQERSVRFPSGLGYRADETFRRDEFTERYMGKTYGNNPTSFHELVSMGLESIWTGSYDLDPEMRRFILGLLAAV